MYAVMAASRIRKATVHKTVATSIGSVKSLVRGPVLASEGTSKNKNRPALMPVSFAQRRAREANVEAAIGQHDDEDDDFSKFMQEIDEVKKSNSEMKRTIRNLRARLCEERRRTKVWRRRCMALTGTYRLPRGRGVIRLKF